MYVHTIFTCSLVSIFTRLAVACDSRMTKGYAGSMTCCKIDHAESSTGVTLQSNPSTGTWSSSTKISNDKALSKKNLEISKDLEDNSFVSKYNLQVYKQLNKSFLF